jgi:hypothetical protein
VCSADFWYLRHETQAAVMSRSAVAVEADAVVSAALGSASKCSADELSNLG